MAFGAEPGAIASAVIVATAGLWWFAVILKDVRRLPRATRWGIYALVWLAYFILVMLLATQLPSNA